MSRTSHKRSFWILLVFVVLLSLCHVVAQATACSSACWVSLSLSLHLCVSVCLDATASWLPACTAKKSTGRVVFIFVKYLSLRNKIQIVYTYIYKEDFPYIFISNVRHEKLTIFFWGAAFKWCCGSAWQNFISFRSPVLGWHCNPGRGQCKRWVCVSELQLSATITITTTYQSETETGCLAREREEEYYEHTYVPCRILLQHWTVSFC